MQFVMMAYVGDKEPEVTRVLNDMEPLIGEQWLVAHRELRTNRRIRVVYDYLADLLKR